MQPTLMFHNFYKLSKCAATLGLLVSHRGSTNIGPLLRENHLKTNLIAL